MPAGGATGLHPALKWAPTHSGNTPMQEDPKFQEASGLFTNITKMVVTAKCLSKQLVGEWQISQGINHVPSPHPDVLKDHEQMILGMSNSGFGPEIATLLLEEGKLSPKQAIAFTPAQVKMQIQSYTSMGKTLHEERMNEHKRKNPGNAQVVVPTYAPDSEALDIQDAIERVNIAEYDSATITTHTGHWEAHIAMLLTQLEHSNTGLTQWYELSKKSEEIQTRAVGQLKKRVTQYTGTVPGPVKAEPGDGDDGMDTSDGLGLGGLNTELELPQYMEAVAHEMDQKITATRKRVEAGKDSQVAIAKAVATRRDIASISSVVTEANDGMTSKKPRIEALIKRFDQNKAAQDIKDDKQ